MTRPDRDTERLEALWEHHYGAVLAYGRRRAPEDVAADVAAQVFTIAWRRIHDVPPEPRAWLLGVATDPCQPSPWRGSAGAPRRSPGR